MTATATPPATRPSSDGAWLWNSWPELAAGGFVDTVQKDAMPGLIAASGADGKSGTWADLKRIVNRRRQEPPTRVLDAMRAAMKLQPFNPDAPWTKPDQEWVAEKLREFVVWYVQNFGEPKDS